MVETVTAAIFNSDENAGQIYPPMLQTMDPMRQLISSKTQMDPLQQDMKVLNPELMITDTAMQTTVMPTEQRMMVYNTARPEETFNPFGAMTKMEMETNQIERRLARQSAHMDALVEDAMKATAAMLPADAAKLDELVNSRVDDLSGGGSSPSNTSHASDVLLSPAAGVVTRNPADLLQPPMTSAISPDVILDPQVSVLFE